MLFYLRIMLHRFPDKLLHSFMLTQGHSIPHKAIVVKQLKMKQTRRPKSRRELFQSSDECMLDLKLMLKTV